MPEDEERDHIRQTVATIRDIRGAPPLGWYTGRYSPNTRRLVMEETETLYDSDAYNDDLPYWAQVAGKPRLIVPYALDTNDFKFALSPGWMSGEDFFTYLKAAFDQLHREAGDHRRGPKSQCTAHRPLNHIVGSAETARQSWAHPRLVTKLEPVLQIVMLQVLTIMTINLAEFKSLKWVFLDQTINNLLRYVELE